MLYEFPVKEVNITLPKWVDELDNGHWLRQKLMVRCRRLAQYIRRLRDIDRAIDDLSGYDFVADVILHDIDLGNGIQIYLVNL